MIQKIKKFIIVGATSLTMLLPGLIPAAIGTSFAAIADGAGTNIASGLCGGINSAANGSNNSGDCSGNAGSGESTLASIAKRIVNIFSLIVGIAAVIMIIVGGFRYITSGGDSNRVGGAKNTLIYAIVGLIIVALAQAIVHFVLSNTASATTNNP
jgi:hypothetical protein